LSAIDVLKLVTLAYPDSADAHENLAEAYLKDGQKDLARQHADKALAILNDHKIQHRPGPTPSSMRRDSARRREGYQTAD
jgi:tetratricopeptide (TPR) repeat protein